MRGSLKLVRVRGITYRAHWSLLLLVLVVAAGFPVSAALYVALILAHELGHASVARRFGGRPDTISVHIFGGFCDYVGVVGARERATIAWGGLAVQAIILCIAMPFAVARAPLVNPIEEQIFAVLVGINALTLVLNALPIPPLDGAEGWTLLTRAVRGARRKSKERRKQEILDELSSLRTENKKPTHLDIN